MKPTVEDRAYWDLLATIVGCIACRKDGIRNTCVSIHHVDGRTKKGAHSLVLPLCDRHHQTGGEEAPSVHPWRRRFIAKYGTEPELMAECNEILRRHDHAAH